MPARMAVSHFGYAFRADPTSRRSVEDLYGALSLERCGEWARAKPERPFGGVFGSGSKGQWGRALSAVES